MTVGSALRVWASATKAGAVFGSGLKVRIRRDRGFMPDVQYYQREQVALLGEHGADRVVPFLAVEIVSPSSPRKGGEPPPTPSRPRRVDRVQKLASYAEIGVTGYWLIDPEDRSLQRFVLRAAAAGEPATERRYEAREGLVDDAVFQPDSFPELELKLGELWAMPG